MNYGAAIRIVRAAHGWSLQRLALKTSVGPSHLSLIESGKRQASTAVLGQIAGALGIRATHLMLLAESSENIAASDADGALEIVRILAKAAAPKRCRRSTPRF